MKTTCMLWVLLGCALGGNAQNLLDNAGFENPDEVNVWPTSNSELHRCLEWEIDQHQETNGNWAHSPDWYVNTPYFLEEDLNSTGTFLPIEGNNHSRGYVGVRACEMFCQELKDPLVKDKHYSLAFYIRIPAQKNRVAQDINRQFQVGFPVQVQVFFSKTKPKYNNALANCDDGESCYPLLADGSDEQVFSNVLTIDPAAFPAGEWHKVITSPLKMDKNWDWIAIQTVRNVENCDSYILIDDVHLQGSGCVQEECLNCSYTSGNKLISCNQVNTAQVPLSISGLSNVSSVGVTVRSILGQPVYFGQFSCLNGWKNGVLAIPLPVLAAGHYELVVAVANDCNHTCVKIFSFIYEDDFQGQIHPCPCRAVGLVKPCCETNLHAKQLNVTCQEGPFVYAAIDRLYVGGNTDFVAPAGAEIEFTATNLVELGPGFSTQSGTTVSIYTAPCASHKVQNNWSDEPTETQSIGGNRLVECFPNPNAGTFTVHCSGEQPISLSVQDMLGRQIHTAKLAAGARAQIDISTFGKGAYLVIATDGEEREIQKILVQ